jgi:hypothetical protein
LANNVRFSLPLSFEVKDKLKASLGIDLTNVENVPMRWIQGDSHPHIDRGIDSFENTYLVYLTDSLGKFIVDQQEYPIQKGNAVVFQEGLRHLTTGAGLEPRLMIGPMSEMAFAVGASVYYYTNELDALNNTYTNYIASSYSYTVGIIDISGSIGSYTSWFIAPNSIGSTTGGPYTNGTNLIGDGGYFLYPALPCFLEGTKILCEINGEEQYVPIEKITKGTLVKTLKHGFLKTELIGKSQIYNSGDSERVKNRLYRLTQNQYPTLKEDLVITGCHSILVHQLTQKQGKKTMEDFGRIFETDGKPRLMAYLDEKAQPYEEEGTFPIYHLALENDSDQTNYGIYANGLLVESCSKRFIGEYGNMTIL